MLSADVARNYQGVARLRTLLRKYVQHLAYLGVIASIELQVPFQDFNSKTGPMLRAGKRL